MKSILSASEDAGAGPESPNVLWLMTDEQRTDSLGCYGSPWARTPVLDALAREGVLFETAVTPSPVCVPARVSLLTGLVPGATQVLANTHRPKEATRFLPGVFREHGYRTGSIGKQHYRGHKRAFGHETNRMISDAVGYFEYGKGRCHSDYGGVRYPHDPYRWIFAGRFPEPAENHPEWLNVTDAMEWLRAGDARTPFFLRVSFNSPHTPVTPPAPYDTLIDPRSIHLPEATDEQLGGQPVWQREALHPIAASLCLSREEIARARQCYYGLVSFVDAQVGRLLEFMEKEGFLENTIIAYVSDHGTMLGDQGLMQKQVFYDPSVNVPYFIHWRGRIKSGRHLKTPVEAVTLLPTLVDLAGLPIPDSVHTPSFGPVLLGCEELPQEPVFSEIDLETFDIRGGDRRIMIRDGKWKLSLFHHVGRTNREPDGCLYDLEADPEERNNLYGDPATASVCEELVDKIDARDRRLGLRPTESP
jgi:arylsulfatase A-like enzyme